MPDWKPDIRAHLSSLSLAPAREAEIIEELTQHLDDRWHDLMAKGETPEDAARIARTEFSGARLTALLGTLQQAHWQDTPPPGQPRARWLDALRIDLRHALRALAATPGFTIGALLVLALGTGATTAIFSVVDAVALRPLPFSHPDRIVALGETGASKPGPGGRPGPGPAPGATPGPMPGAAQTSGKGGLPGRPPMPKPRGPVMPGMKPGDPDALARIEPQNYLDWAARQRVFESIAAIADGGEFTLRSSTGAEPQVVHGHRVTASFFDVLRARPLIGAPFTSSREVVGSHRVAVLSHAFWMRQFGGDVSIVGRTLSLNDESFEIVGVMPADFTYPIGASQPAEIWIPWVPAPQERVRGGLGRSIYLQSIARLKPGVSLDQARAQMSQVAADLAVEYPATNTGRGIGVRPLRDHFVGASVRTWMLMLLAAVGIVLLIACANVANLWLARASVQQRDVAVRAALGASRGRLMQRFLIESLLVSIAGTILGVGLAWQGTRVLAAAMPESLARVAAIGIDLRVLAVAAVLSLVTGLAAGIVPAFQGSLPMLGNLLNESSRAGGLSSGRRRLREALVVAEVALAFVLLIGAALFIGSFVNLMRVDSGFSGDRVLTAQIFPASESGAPRRELQQEFTEIVERLRQLPGVIDAAVATPGIPLRINMWISALSVPGRTIDGDTSVSVKTVTPAYHRALEIPLRSGRLFTDDDRAGAESVIILSESAARVFFPGEDAVGQTVVFGDVTRRVAGVVANARQASLEVSPHPEIYLPFAQASRETDNGFIVVRTSGDPNESIAALRGIVAQVLPREPLRHVARLDDLLAAQAAERRLSMLMFGLFGILGLIISAVGIFSVIAYLVANQTKEIGVRMALGATQSRVITSVLAHAAGLVTVGLVIGSLASWWLSTAASRFLFLLDARDPRAYIVAITTLLAAGLAASAFPALRAARISPIDALRSE